MKTEHRPEYLKSLQARVDAIGVVPHDERPRAPSPVEEGLAPGIEIKPEEILDFREWISDSHGRRKGAVFHSGGERLAIKGEGFEALRKVAADVLKRFEAEEAVSPNFVEDVLIDYVKKSVLTGERPPIETVLVPALLGGVKPCAFHFPLSGTEGNVAFTFCGVSFHPPPEVFADMIALHERTAREHPDHAQEIVHKAATLARDYGRSMWASVEIEAEPKLAAELAYERVRNAAHILRALSVRGYHPAHHIGMKPGAVYSQGQFNTYVVAGEGGTQDASVPGWQPIYLTKRSLPTFVGLGNVERLFHKPEKTDLDKLCLRALVVLGSVAAMSDLTDKIVYGCTALDMLYSKSKDEPILAMMPRRFALQVGDALAERKEVLQAVKHAYDLRSGKVHAGRDAAPDERIDEFFRRLYMLATQLVFVAEKYPSHAAYIEALEDRLLSD